MLHKLCLIVCISKKKRLKKLIIMLLVFMPMPTFEFFKTEHGCWSRNMVGFPVEENEISFLNT